MDKLYVCWSPFSRTAQTAEHACHAMGLATMHGEEACELRERYFGQDMELGSHSTYADVWEVDSTDPHQKAGGTGESVHEVAARVKTLLERLNDTEDPPSAILLVSHGDTLQITQAMLTGDDERLKGHRSFALETGELRRLNPRKSQYLPSSGHHA